MMQTNSIFSTWFWIVLILIIIAVVIANDANNRGHNGFLWGIIVVMMPGMGILFYLAFVIANPTTKPYNDTPRTYNTQQYTPPVSTETTPTGKFCITCGASNLDTADFCIKCGTKIPRN